MDSDDGFRRLELHRGVPLEDQQSDERLALVRAEIDLVLGMSDPGELADHAGDPRHSPEVGSLRPPWRRAIWTMAAETRAVRPVISLEKLHASVAGLGSGTWRDPDRHASLLDHGGVEREEPLDDLE